MRHVTVPVDGHLPGSLDRLHTAVAALVDERKELVQGVVRVAPSRYDELVSEVPAATGGYGVLALRQAKSVAPVWLDGLDLLNVIDTAVAVWHPAGDSTPTRLRALCVQRWRPMDCHGIDAMTQIVGQWTVQIDVLLNPQHVKRISAPCPACGSTHVYRRDSAGEIVRQAALQIVAEQGCTCQSCHATWTPDLYIHLCRVLGFDVPAGVLE
jgi:hypothetical protein